MASVKCGKCCYHLGKKFTSDEHKTLENWYKDIQSISDFSIKTEDGAIFPVHRMVLYCASPFFNTLIKSSRHSTFIIQGIDKPILEHVLRFIYVDVIHITDQNVCDLLLAADFFLMDDLIMKCIHFITHNLSVQNCIQIFLVSVVLPHIPIGLPCLRFIQFHCEVVLKENEDLCRLPYDQLVELLLDSWINVSGEDIIWMAIIKWTEFDPEYRYLAVHNLINCIRLPYLPESYIDSYILGHTIVKNNIYCTESINQVKQNSKDYSHEATMLDITSSTGLTCQNAKIRKPCHIYVFVEQSNFMESQEACQILEIFNDAFDYWRKLGSTNFFPDTMFEIDGILYLMEAFRDVKYAFDIISKTGTDMPPLLEPRTEYVVLSFEKEIYVIGGIDYTVEESINSYSASVEKFNLETKIWTKLPSMNHPLSGPAVECGGKILAIGDYYDQSLDLFVLCGQAYDPKEGVWCDFSVPIVYRRCFALTVYRDRVYVIGGRNSGGLLHFVEKYDPNLNEWTHCEDMPFSYEFPKAVVLEDVLVVYEDNYDGRETWRPHPATYWDEITSNWKIASHNPAYNELYRYLFCKIEDINTIQKMRPYNASGCDWVTADLDDGIVEEKL